VITFSFRTATVKASSRGEEEHGGRGESRLNADLEALIRLQQTRDRITSLTTRIESEIPTNIAELETALREIRERVDEGQSVIEAAQKERLRLELDLKTADEKITKYKAALMQVKTNEEYRAALNEIDYTNRTRSELETRVLELMEDVDQRREELGGLEEELRVEDEKIHADRKVLEEERDAFIAERAAEEKMVADIEDGLSRQLVQAYRRIAAVRGGVALARAAKGVCIACNMRLRPAVYQTVKRNERVVTCDSCGRILYYEEQSGVEAAEVPEDPGQPATVTTEPETASTEPAVSPSPAPAAPSGVSAESSQSTASPAAAPSAPAPAPASPATGQGE
jgi:predicted  nucleic acid-binding Zn-ribbon protein